MRQLIAALVFCMACDRKHSTAPWMVRPPSKHEAFFRSTEAEQVKRFSNMQSDERLELAVEALGREPPNSEWLVLYSCSTLDAWETLIANLSLTDSDRLVADLAHGLLFTPPVSSARRSVGLDKLGVRIARMPEGAYKSVANRQMKELNLGTDRHGECDQREAEMNQGGDH